MALGRYDALCAQCAIRLGQHGKYYLGSGEIKFYCPIQKPWSNLHWTISDKLTFIDSGKKRSTYCDQRNNPGLYIF